MKLRISKYLFLLVMAVFALSSCSENDDSYDAYANWQERNEQAFLDTLAYAKKMGESQGWYVYRNWSLENQTPNKDVNGVDVPLSYKDCDHIIVHVLKEGKGSGCPMYTDSVKVSFLGRLLGTDTYPAGYVFDKTFEGTYDKATAQVTTNLASGWIDGFTTAVLKMHIGDHWQVYIPYQLAYGTTQNGTIPAYSMLRFEIVLDSYYRPGQVIPGSRAVEGGRNKGTWITE